VTRTVTTDVGNALAAAAVPVIAFVEMDFAGGVVRATNAPYTIEWNSQSWTGLGNLGGIEVIDEGANMEAFGVALRLSGVPAELLAIALGETYQGRDCSIWCAPLDADHAIIADPVLVFLGRMDTMEISMANGQGVITLSAESRLVDLERPRVRRYNDADQQAEYPGDLGLQFVEQMVEKELVWGRG